MWIVRLALRRPYTFVVVSVLIAILGIAAVITTPKDIFPNINIPVISVVWSYTGLTPDDMEKRMVTVTERAMTTTVNDIEHIESQSYNGVAIIKVFFQPNVKPEMALAQINSICQTLAARAAAGNHAAVPRQVRRVVGAGAAAWTFRTRAERAAAL